MCGGKRKRRKRYRLEWRDFLHRYRNNRANIRRKNEDVTGSDFGIRNVERLGAPLLHVILKSPVTFKPDGYILALKTSLKLARSFLSCFSLAIIGRDNDQRQCCRHRYARDGQNYILPL